MFFKFTDIVRSVPVFVQLTPGITLILHAMKNFLFLCLIITIFPITNHAQRMAVPEIGVVQRLENDSLLHAQGYRYLVESTATLLSPRKVSEQQFKAHLKQIKSSAIPLFACNIFLPGELKVVGPEVDEKAILDYVNVVFQRGRAAGIEMIIWGSGGSRRVPDGFDRLKATAQFISIARKVAAAARKYNIILALENLNTSEANFINTVAEAYEIAKAVDHPNFRICADIYHMLKEGESPEIIEKVKPYLHYCELAEKENRTPPGVHGQNFKPYLTALQKIGYRGKIVIECRWDDIDAQGATTYQVLRKQIDEVYKSR